MIPTLIFYHFDRYFQWYFPHFKFGVFIYADSQVSGTNNLYVLLALIRYDLSLIVISMEFRIEFFQTVRTHAMAELCVRMLTDI